ncbi:MAG: hypothetical protein IPL46_10225 [Saprospiraceae bacterium]|nr:hypothetical protein [Saprospiraceae bacterium]
MSKNDLQTLRELAQVVTRNKVKSLGILSKKSPESKVYDFYERLLDDSFTNDEEAAEYYYSEDDHHPQYRKLKNKLKERLIDTSFFIDTNHPKFNSHQKAFYTCHKRLVAVKILLGRYARNPAIELAIDTLRLSERFEFFEIALELCKMLRNHFALHYQNHTQYKKYVELISKYKIITDEEELVASMYDETSILLKKLSENKERVVELCDAYEKELSLLREHNNSFRFNLQYFFLLLRRDDLKSDYSKIINTCDNALEYLSGKRFVSQHFGGAFYYHKLMASIQVRDFESSSALAEKCSGLFEVNTIRWYNAQEICFIFSLRSGQYRKALSIREKVTNIPDFKNQFQNRQETWKLYDSFLYYLSIQDRLKIPDTSSLYTFRVRKFLNEVPKYSMDKSGYNIPILIIQILIQIHQKKYDQLTDKIEAIEKYSTRYLRKDNNYRSNCFIKMLLHIPKQHFHRLAIERHTKSLMAKLKSIPLEKASQPFEIEIIPYEDLWQMALEQIN